VAVAQLLVVRPIHTMSAFDTAKEIVRIGSTAGLSKDVIDLLEKKSSLLVEKVVALERENAQLKLECGQLRQQLQHPKPVRELSDDQRAVLLHLMQNDAGLTLEEIAQSIGAIPSMAHHYCDELESVGFITRTRFPFEHRRIYGPDWGFALTKEGRKWIADQSA
jgi:DNA-binding MarR family transcriptional regulator